MPAADLTQLAEPACWTTVICLAVAVRLILPTTVTRGHCATHAHTVNMNSRYYLRQIGYVFVVVCLSVCLLATLRKNFRTDLHEIFKEGCNGRVNKWLNFGGAPDNRLQIQGLFSAFVAIGRYRKRLTDINLLLILIRQMTALVWRALVEVCTVPVLLVVSCLYCILGAAGHSLSGY